MAVENPIFVWSGWRRSARSKRRISIVMCLLIVAAGFLAYWYGPAVADRIRAIAWRRECLSYIPPAQQVVYEEEPSAVAALQNQPGYELTEGARLRWIPDCWRNETPNSSQLQGTVFLHQRASPSGHVRLVAVDLNVEPGSLLSSTGDIEDISFVESILIPGGGFKADKPVCLGNTIMWICPVDPKPMRFYAGLPDLNDPSRFSFAYERAGKQSMIDGRLNDDDTISLMPRRGTVSHAREPLLWEPDEDAAPAVATQPVQ